MFAYNCAEYDSFSPMTPKQINIQEIYYNHDGILDALIERGNGYKVPMYGVRGKTGKITYFSASVMEKRNPDSVVNYSKIEQLLNEKPND